MVFDQKKGKGVRVEVWGIFNKKRSEKSFGEGGKKGRGNLGSGYEKKKIFGGVFFFLSRGLFSSIYIDIILGGFSGWEIFLLIKFFLHPLTPPRS